MLLKVSVTPDSNSQLKQFRFRFSISAQEKAHDAGYYRFNIGTAFAAVIITV